MKKRNKQKQTGKVVPTIPTHIKSRFDQLRKDSENSVTAEDNLNSVKYLLICNNYPLAKDIFGKELLDQVVSSADFFPRTISFILQNNALDTLKCLARDYKEILNNNLKFANIISSRVQDKNILTFIMSNITLPSPGGKNLLHLAVDADNLDLISLLVNLDPKLISQVDNKGSSPLNYAAAYFMNRDFVGYTSSKDVVQTIEKMCKRKKSQEPGVVEMIKGSKVVEILTGSDAETMIKGLETIEILVSQGKKLNANQLSYKICDALVGLDCSKISFPESIQSYAFFGNGKHSMIMVATYLKALYANGYSNKEWESMKNEIPKLIEKYIVEKKVNLLDMAYNFFSVSHEAMTLESFIKLCGFNKKSKKSEVAEIKLFILSKLVQHNEEIGDLKLALMQSTEALELSKDLDEKEMKKLSWYNNVMYKICISYTNTFSQVNGDYQNPKPLEVLELSQKYIAVKNSTNYIVGKFNLLDNMNLMTSDKGTNFINSINDQEVKAFLSQLIIDVNKITPLFKAEIETLLNKIANPQSRNECQKLLKAYQKDKALYLREPGYEGLILQYFVEKKDIIGLTELCERSSDDTVKEQILAAIDTDIRGFQLCVRHEVFHICKALIYSFLGKHNQIAQTLLSMKTDNLSSLPTMWKNLFCEVLAVSVLNHNEDLDGSSQNLAECIAKIKLVDPSHFVLELMENDDTSEDESTPQGSLLDSSAESSPKKKVWTKSEVLALSKKQFLQLVQEGDISLGVQKAYYKQLGKNELSVQLAKSLEKGFTANQEKVESWILPSGKVVKSDNKNVFHVGNKLWAFIDEGLLDVLDSATREKFQNSISTARPGNDNIKYIHNIAELTIKGDLRLYTDTKYSNHNKAVVIRLDQSDNHKEIKKEIDNDGSSMNIIDVDSITEDDAPVIHLPKNTKTYGHKDHVERETYEHKGSNPDDYEQQEAYEYKTYNKEDYNSPLTGEQAD